MKQAGRTRRWVCLVLALVLAAGIVPYRAAAENFWMVKAGAKLTLKEDSEAILTKGDSIRLSAAKKETVSCESDNPSVAEALPDGTVTARKAGQATITLKAGKGKGKEKEYRLRVTVRNPKDPYIRFTRNILRLHTGSVKSADLKPLLKAVNWKKFKAKTVTWSSSDPRVAEVSASGTVKAKKPGKAVITARTAKGPEAFLPVEVVKKNKIDNISHMPGTGSMSYAVSLKSVEIRNSRKAVLEFHVNFNYPVQYEMYQFRFLQVNIQFIPDDVS